MNRLNTLFDQKKNNILSLYFTAGHMGLNTTETILQEIEKAGVDFVEIGMPFSDPVADGPTIQKSSEKALENGMSLNVLFEELKNIRQSVSMPLILMGYLNPVMKYGIENFCKKCQEVGIDGLILPDLPFDLYEDQYKAMFESYGLSNVFLITPQTSEARIKQIDAASSSFIYMVSSNSITGSKGSAADYNKEYFKRTAALELKTPRIIGFGISNKETFDNACQYASGAIIGSRFVKELGTEENLSSSIQNFVKTIK